MAYIDQATKKALSPAVKAVLDKYKLKGSLSINNHSSLVLTIKSGVLDFFGNYNAQMSERNARPSECVRQDNMEINTCWINDYYTDKVQECLLDLTAAMKTKDWHNKTDITTDYFDISYYVNIYVGRWDKPYIKV